MIGADSHGSHGRVTGGIWDRIPLFWRFQLVGWLAFTIFSFPTKWVIIESLRESVIVALFRDGLGFFVTIGMREIYRRCYHEKMTKAALVGLVGGVSLASGLVLTLFSLGFHEFLDFKAEKTFTPPVIFGIFYFRTGLCLGWSLLYFGIKLMRESMDRDIRLAQAQATSERAELQMLRTQMNPHFLFNALNTIHADLGKPERNPKGLVQSLAAFLRYSLAHRDDDLVPLGCEFDSVSAYLTVEKARFREELEMECTIDDNTRKAAVPGILLQPLVENAIKYGRQTSELPLKVRVRIPAPQAGRVRLEVSNTGRWLEAEPDRKVGGIGLSNLRQRLEILYPGNFRMDTTEEAGWVTVRVEIPVVSS